MKIEKEISFLYKEISGFFWFIIKEHEIAIVFYSIIIFLVAFCLVLWIIKNDEEEETIDEAKKEVEE